MRVLRFDDLPDWHRSTLCARNIGPLEKLPADVRNVIQECPYGFNATDAFNLLHSGMSADDVVAKIWEAQHTVREILIEKGVLPSWVREFPIGELKARRNRLKRRESQC